VVFRLITVQQAWGAVLKGTDVYFFLAGMMLLAEMARRQGLFDWLATHAVTAARGSRTRLFLLVYWVGVAVTTLLSNDATAVVLTPAVYAAVKKARASVMPYLLICAFIANAASFVLPISNPANLVIFGAGMPPLAVWLRFFALPSLLAVVATYVALRVLTRGELEGKMAKELEASELSGSGRLVALGIAGTALVLLTASALGKDLGLPTLAAALVVFAGVLAMDRRAFAPVLKDIAWGVLPLVAGLFVIVEGLDVIGAVEATRAVLRDMEHWAPLAGTMSASFGVAVVCNVANNLPVGLLAGSAVQDHVPQVIRNALVVGVDLGPNFSVTGSLATILWLIALRREGETVGFWEFLKYGVMVTPPALLLATSALLIGR
jgi:arsenical pump membrane protein